MISNVVTNWPIDVYETTKNEWLWNGYAKKWPSPRKAVGTSFNFKLKTYNFQQNRLSKHTSMFRLKFLFLNKVFQLVHFSLCFRTYEIHFLRNLVSLSLDARTLFCQTSGRYWSWQTMELHNFRCCNPSFETKNLFKDDNVSTSSSEEQESILLSINKRSSISLQFSYVFATNNIEYHFKI